MTNEITRRSAPLAALLCVLSLAACGGSTASSSPASSASAPANPSTPANASPSAPTAGGSVSPSAGASGGQSQAPDVPGGKTSGDIPDNAVFLTYKSAGLGFSIKYVEGWQVTTQSDGVVIRDKDSSETVQVVAPQSDVGAYITYTDLPALQAQAGFKLVKRDSVKVGSQTYEHLAYHVLSPPDPVTGKQVPSIVDRYYVPGPKGLALVSLSTPDGVDNIDAFRMLMESFAWT